MHRIALAFAGAALLTGAAPPPQDPGARTVGDTVTQPLSDVNIKRREIPPALLAIRDNPYAMDGIRTCRQIIAEITTLNTLLGVDFDEVQTDQKGEKRKDAALSLAGSAITGFIPFRGIIREVTGANRADENFRSAIIAGGIRRAFLKGVGQQRKCRPPGRPQNAREQAQDAAELIAIEAADEAEKAKPKKSENEKSHNEKRTR